MAMSSDSSPVRISKIAGRYLVFDPDAVARLRRQHNINGLLVGTTPQQPTQNIFLGLPIELRGEEAGALVSAGAAFIVDDAAAHRDALTGGRSGANAYVEALRKRKVAAQKALAEQKAQKAADAASRHKTDRSKAKARPTPRTAPEDGEPCSLFDGDVSQRQQQQTQMQSKKQVERGPEQIAVTPTSSDDLLPPETIAQHTLSSIPNGPLVRLLRRTGYFMTPGLRFGSQYSVYPGDPLRFHAHFMANEYGWEEPISTLELVEGGRLATAVKKAFLIGGQKPGGDGGGDDEEVRTFSIEWAAM